MNRWGVVVGVNAEDGNSYDILMLDNGARLTGVKQLSQNATARSGSTSVLDIPDRGESKWDVSKLKPEECIRACVSAVPGGHVIQGFLPPEVGQMNFKDRKLQVERHNSDVIRSVDGDGNMEIAHPSGAYIRIGETPDHVDLSGKDVDGKLKVDRNTGRKVHLRVALAGNVVKLTMTPEGKVTLEMDEDFDLTAKGDINMKAEGDVNIEAGGKMALKSPSEITADAPKVENPNGDIIASKVSLVQHPHKDTMPQSGSQSGPPLPAS